MLFSVLFRALPETPFHQGVNLTDWLQAPDVDLILPELFGEKDFQEIRSLGCDVVRLPINLARMAAAAPDGRIPKKLFALLDRAVAWASANGLALILDNHTLYEKERMDPDMERVLPGLWRQMASHFKDAPPDVIYEILNEPHDIPPRDWDRIQRAALAAIREIDRGRTVVVTGSDWGGIDGLVALRPYDDPNLLYSFHFYDPFVFTHQGADWANQAALSGVHFPPDPGRPPVIGAFPGRATLEREVRRYLQSDALAEMRAQLDKAAAWAAKYGKRIFCGEFGVYAAKADPGERANWYRITRDLLVERGIPFTSWDYKDSFGLFNYGSDELFDHDLNIPLLHALGLRSPPQTPYLRKPEERGFSIYGDSVAAGIRIDSWADRRTIDFSSTDSPIHGEYCLRFSGARQYDSVTFRFTPTRDLSLLAKKGASLGLWLRTRGGAATFDLRFVEAATPGALPWRMNRGIDSAELDADGRWVHLDLPLASFVDGGAWDGSWHEPAGRFDWSNIASFDIVAEKSSLDGVELFFNGIELGDPASSAP
jgi:endoglucanase